MLTLLFIHMLTFTLQLNTQLFQALASVIVTVITCLVEVEVENCSVVGWCGICELSSAHLPSHTTHTIWQKEIQCSSPSERHHWLTD